jgi:hypothetical protein
MSESARSHPLEDRCDPELVAVLRRQSPAARLATLDSMWRSAVTLVRCGVAARHRDWSEAEISAETARRMASRSGQDGHG